MNDDDGDFISIPQIANHTGYIKVDWKRVEKDVNKAKKQLKQGTKQAGPEINTMVEKVTAVVSYCGILLISSKVCIGFDSQKDAN